MSLASASAWSKSVARSIVSTGPKISSVAIRALGSSVTATVGPRYHPPSGTSSRSTTTSASSRASDWYRRTRSYASASMSGPHTVRRSWAGPTGTIRAAPATPLDELVEHRAPARSPATPPSTSGPRTRTRCARSPGPRRRGRRRRRRRSGSCRPSRPGPASRVVARARTTAARSMICRPTAFDPVNATNATAGCSTRCGADLLADAREEGEHTGRDARLVEDLDQTQRDAGRLLRRLEQHGVAGDQRGGDHAGGDREREVPRRDHDADAERLVRVRVGSRPGPGRCAIHPRAGVPPVRSTRRSRSPRRRRRRPRRPACRPRRPRAPRARPAAPRRIAAARKRIAARSRHGTARHAGQAAAATSSARSAIARSAQPLRHTTRSNEPGSTDVISRSVATTFPSTRTGATKREVVARRHRRRARDGRAPWPAGAPRPARWRTAPARPGR